MPKVCEMVPCLLKESTKNKKHSIKTLRVVGSVFLDLRTRESGWPLPEFEGCSADTIMVVAVWGPVTNDCVVAVGTSVPCGVVITNPAKRKRNTITVCVMH